MALYGFRYQSTTISTYNTSGSVKSERGGSVSKPFAPFVPKFNSGDEYVGKKNKVPVGRRPYEYESDDEWKREPVTNPAPASPRKLDPPRPIPVTSPHSGHSSQPKLTSTPLYDHGHPAALYGDYNNKHRYKPRLTSTPVINDDHGDYNSKEGYKPKSTVTPVYDDGYGTDYGDYNNKGYKPRPSGAPVYNDRYGPDYGDYNNNKEGYKPRPSATPVYNDGYGPDYGDYNNKEGHKPRPSATPVHNDGYGPDYGDYNNKEGYKPRPSETPVHNDGYGPDYGDYNNKEVYKPRPSATPVYNDGYGNYNNKEGYKPKTKPTGTPVHNNGYGDDYGSYSNKERSKPKPTDSPVYNDGYGGDYSNHNKEGPTLKSTEIPIYSNRYGIGGASPARGDYGLYGNYPNNKEANKHPGPKTTSGWPETPRKGTQLSKPMNDIDEAIEMLKKEAAMLNGIERGYNGGPKQHDSKPYSDGPDGGPKTYEKKPYYDGPGPLGSRPASAAGTNEKNMNLVNESEKLKKIVTNAPQTPTPSKGNFSLSSQRPFFNFNDERRPDYGVIDHKEAERKFNGMTI